MKLDVKRLYTNISHYEGIKACCDAVQYNQTYPKPPLWFFKNAYIISLRRIILNLAASVSDRLWVLPWVAGVLSAMLTFLWTGKDIT